MLFRTHIVAYKLLLFAYFSLQFLQKKILYEKVVGRLNSIYDRVLYTKASRRLLTVTVTATKVSFNVIL